VFITVGPIKEAVSGGGEGENGGHVLKNTTSNGLCVRVWPPHTIEWRGGGGGALKFHALYRKEP